VKRQQPRSPLEILTLVAEHFLSTAEELDERVANAIANDASHGDIVALMGLSDEKRMKAATVAEKAVPYTTPRLQAIEVAAASVATRDKFADRTARLTDEEAMKYIAAYEAGMPIAEIADELEH
jgi:hypothetical protein